MRSRPRIGDRGILSVFYHDIKSLKDKGGFQAPDAIRVMAIDSASWRPGLPNHADVNASPEYPSDDEWELNGNGVKIKLTSPVDGDSQSPNKMDVTVGTVQFTIEVPQDGTPTVTLNAPDGAITVNAKTANVNLTQSGTVTADTSVKIDTPATTITGTLKVDGAITAGSTLDVTGATTIGATLDVTGAITGSQVTAGAIPLSTHKHGGVSSGSSTSGTPVP